MGKTCRAKVQQPAFSAGGDIDVVGADVPMQQVHGVDLDQGLHNGLEDGQGLGVGDLVALVGKVCLQAHAVDVLHDEVGGVIFFKIILYGYNVRGVLKFC